MSSVLTMPTLPSSSCDASSRSAVSHVSDMCGVGAGGTARPTPSVMEAQHGAASRHAHLSAVLGNEFAHRRCAWPPCAPAAVPQLCDTALRRLAATHLTTVPARTTLTRETAHPASAHRRCAHVTRTPPMVLRRLKPGSCVAAGQPRTRQRASVCTWRSPRNTAHPCTVPACIPAHLCCVGLSRTYQRSLK
jgi:hypothetical protein